MPIEVLAVLQLHSNVYLQLSLVMYKSIPQIPEVSVVLLFYYTEADLNKSNNLPKVSEHCDVTKITACL